MAFDIVIGQIGHEWFGTAAFALFKRVRSFADFCAEFQSFIARCVCRPLWITSNRVSAFAASDAVIQDECNDTPCRYSNAETLDLIVITNGVPLFWGLEVLYRALRDLHIVSVLCPHRTLSSEFQSPRMSSYRQASLR
jgi:hypothetical protein